MLGFGICFVVFVISLTNGATFKNCDNSFPIQLYFTMPDPLIITLGEPLKLVAGADLHVEIPLKLKVKHIMEKRILGEWVKIPCVEHIGSCIDDMDCQEFIDMGFNGTCPIKIGVYRNYHVSMPIPKFPVPAFLTNGLYRIHIEGYTYDMSEMIFCGGMTQYIEQGKTNHKKELQRIFSTILRDYE